MGPGSRDGGPVSKRAGVTDLDTGQACEGKGRRQPLQARRGPPKEPMEPTAVSRAVAPPVLSFKPLGLQHFVTVALASQFSFCLCVFISPFPPSLPSLAPLVLIPSPHPHPDSGVGRRGTWRDTRVRLRKETRSLGRIPLQEGEPGTIHLPALPAEAQGETLPLREGVDLAWGLGLGASPQPPEHPRHPRCSLNWWRGGWWQVRPARSPTRVVPVGF